MRLFGILKLTCMFVSISVNIYNLNSKVEVVI